MRGGNFTIGPHADLRGKASYRGERQPEVSSQAKLASPLSVEIVKHRPNYFTAHFYRSQVLRMAAAFVLGLFLMFLMPDFFARVISTSDRVGAPLGFGVLALVVTPIVAVLACITLVGIPVGITALLLYIVALYSAQVFVGAWLGEKILGPGVGRGVQVGRLALGLVLLRVASHVPVLSGVVLLFVILLGLGAMVLTAYERINPSAGRVAGTPA